MRYRETILVKRIGNVEHYAVIESKDGTIYNSIIVDRFMIDKRKKKSQPKKAS